MGDSLSTLSYYVVQYEVTGTTELRRRGGNDTWHTWDPVGWRRDTSVDGGCEMPTHPLPPRCRRPASSCLPMGLLLPRVASAPSRTRALASLPSASCSRRDIKFFTSKRQPGSLLMSSSKKRQLAIAGTAVPSTRLFPLPCAARPAERPNDLPFLRMDAAMTKGNSSPGARSSPQLWTGQRRPRVVKANFHSPPWFLWLWDGLGSCRSLGYLVQIHSHSHSARGRIRSVPAIHHGLPGCQHFPACHRLAGHPLHGWMRQVLPPTSTCQPTATPWPK